MPHFSVRLTEPAELRQTHKYNPPPRCLTSSPSPPLHQIVFLPQINKHYQRVADYGPVEAASVCWSSDRPVSITARARRPEGNTQEKVDEIQHTH